jgi:hypothetical protein
MERLDLVLLAAVFAMIALIPSIFSQVPLTAYGNGTTNLVIYCSNCDSGTCSCFVNNCQSGTIDFYNSSSCNAIPYYEQNFGGGSFSFSLTNTTYLKAYCDDGNQTPCSVANYYAPVTITTAAPSSCKAQNKVCTDNSPCCSGLTCQNNICIPTNTTTSTTSTTTTTSTQSECPYECCSNEQNYFDKPCGDGTACYSHICANTLITTTTTTSASPQISYSLFASSFVAILLLVFLIYFVFGRVLGSASARGITSKVKKERTVPK